MAPATKLQAANLARPTLVKPDDAPARARNKFIGHLNARGHGHHIGNPMRCLVKVSIVVDVAACLRAIAIILSMML